MQNLLRIFSESRIQFGSLNSFRVIVDKKFSSFEVEWLLDSSLKIMMLYVLVIYRNVLFIVMYRKTTLKLKIVFIWFGLFRKWIN